MQEQTCPVMLQRRLSRTACAVMLIFMALALFAYNLFCSYSGIFMPLWTGAVFEAAALLIPCVMLLLLCRSDLPHEKLTGKRTMLIVGMGVTGYGFTLMLNVVWTLVWTAVLSGADIADAGSMDLIETVADTPLWALLLIIAVVPAICEEVFFRGMLMRSMSANPAAAVCSAAVLFALLHYDLTKLYVTFALGLFIGWVVMRSGNLTGGVILHFINNAFAVLTLKGMVHFYHILGTNIHSEQAIYDALMTAPDLLSAATVAMVCIMLLFVLSIPLFFLFLTLFLRDTKAQAQAMHTAAVRMCDAGEDRDRLGRVLLIAAGVLMAVIMLYSHGVFEVIS